MVGGLPVRALAGDLTLHLPLTCPRCGQVAVHLWFREAGGLGASWAWCSACRATSHSPMDGTPSWWRNLDLPGVALTPLPDQLDRAAEQLDAHVNHLLGAARASSADS
ncbi:hypothetical protein KSP35_06325 [Aquihabitans sp. G128]|uniref:hypothetical protein n=1 Tax=Aquihabitans sp. G128 TaxID=2849779 RepID=UPI001C224B83|nr:hypothetical protein [Aquihabitans sp. G128]QXC62413.1 hypothetical protein KSP35_06325 [Aquihabitans sp. G128]